MGIKVNFSDNEASAQSLTLLPVGMYKANIYEIELREVESDAKGNQGKPYYSVELKVDGGPYDGRSMFDNIMLFDGALYSLSKLVKALGLPEPQADQEYEVPDADDLIGKAVVVRLAKKAAKGDYDEGRRITGYYPENFEIKANQMPKEESAASSKKNSLLP